MKKCGGCTYYERSGFDYGECRINPGYSYTHCQASCEDFQKKVATKKSKRKLKEK